MPGEDITTRVPVTWGAGRFDADTRENMGTDSIPTLADAIYHGKYSAQDKLCGVGSDDDLLMVDIDEALTGPMYSVNNHPSGIVWNPVVEPGYFYINDSEYYLFANKGTVSGIPNNGVLYIGTFSYQYPPNGAPIIVTSGGVDPNSPFGKTYEYPVVDDNCNQVVRTPTKFRQIVDLSGKKEYVADGNDLVPYSFKYGHMTFTFESAAAGSQYQWYIRCYPSGFMVSVEYEISGSGYYTVSNIDINPMNNQAASNAMLAIADNRGSGLHRTQTPVVKPKNIVVTNAYRHITPAGGKAIFIASVTSSDGAPVKDVEVNFSTSRGTVSPQVATTAHDGTAYTVLTMGSIISDGAIVSATCSPAIGSGWIQFGKLS